MEIIRWIQRSAKSLSGERKVLYLPEEKL